MEKSFELSERREADNLELISGSVATTLPQDHYSRIDRKQAQRSSCMQYCCTVTFAVISVLALCAAVAAIILVVAFPNVANPAVQEILVLKDQLTGQLASTSTPSSDTTSEELQRIRETLEASVNSISSSLQASLSTVSTLLERIATGEYLSTVIVAL